MPTSRAGRRANSSAGYTLLELLIVIGILALATTVVAFRLPGSQERARFEVAVRDLATELRSARGTAIARGVETAFWIRFDTGRYGIEGKGGDQTLPLEVSIVMAGAQEALRGPGAGRVLFLPDGSSTGATLELTTNERRTVVRVDWLTGDVAIEN